MITLTPEEWNAYLAQLEAMSHDELVHEAKRWRFQSDLYRQKERAILASVEALSAEDKRRLAKVWALIDLRKKTVSAAALHAIFTSSELDDIPEVPAKPTERVEVAGGAL